MEIGSTPNDLQGEETVFVRIVSKTAVQIAVDGYVDDGMCIRPMFQESQNSNTIHLVDV